MRPNRQPCHCKKRDTGDQAYVSNEDADFLVVRDSLIASREALFVFLERIHFSDAQAFTSVAMFPRSEFKPDPKPYRPPRTERMNVLVASRGSVETLWQKSCQIPSCSRYISTLER